ncbi:MAG: transposase [Desulfobacterales bacterium]|nr:transposase [Desulfobacterales bacterium]
MKNITIREINQLWNEKISIDDDYEQLDKLHTLKVHTFIARLIRHIPDKHFPMIRYASLFSNRF